MNPDPLKYRDRELLEAFESVDRDKYPETYEVIKAELTRRGYSPKDQCQEDRKLDALFKDLRETKKLRIYAGIVLTALGLAAWAIVTVVRWLFT